MSPPRPENPRLLLLTDATEGSMWGSVWAYRFWSCISSVKVAPDPSQRRLQGIQLGARIALSDHTADIQFLTAFPQSSDGDSVTDIPGPPSPRRVQVIDVGLGNVGSVSNMLRRVGAAPSIGRHPPDTLGDEPLLLPGIGAFDEGMLRLEKSGWRDALAELPPTSHVLGICLGMQLLGHGSEEGSMQGLGRIDMSFRRFTGVDRVPHMGWNRVLPSQDPLFSGPDQERRFYFAHTYHAVCDDTADVIGETVYGAHFPSAVRRGNTVGFQFHPEKSHRYGMLLLREWVASTCS